MTNNKVQYIFTPGGDINGIPEEDKTVLKRLELKYIGYRWYWWDKTNPFNGFKENAIKNPMWERYKPTLENEVERGYTIFLQDNTKLTHQLDDNFCALYNCIHDGYNIMIQGRNEDENNPTKAEKHKRRRPILRASFCWCVMYPSGGLTPLDVNVSVQLEDKYLAGVHEERFQFGQGQIWIVNFDQNRLTIQAGQSYDLKRYGTQVKRHFVPSSSHATPTTLSQPQPQTVAVATAMTQQQQCFTGNVIGGSNLVTVPLTWEQQQGQYLFSGRLSSQECNFIRELPSVFNQCTISH